MIAFALRSVRELLYCLLISTSELQKCSRRATRTKSTSSSGDLDLKRYHSQELIQNEKEGAKVLMQGGAQVRSRFRFTQLNLVLTGRTGLNQNARFAGGVAAICDTQQRQQDPVDWPWHFQVHG